MVCLAYFYAVAGVRRVLVARAVATRPLRGTSLAFVVVGFGALTLLAPRLVEQDKAQHAGLVNLILTSPLARETKVERMGAEEFVATARRLGLTHAALDGRLPVAGSPRDLNVLLVITESSYNRYLSLFGAKEQTQPLLSHYRDRMELFPNFFSVFPNSLHARFAILNGLYPVRQYISEVNPRIPCRSLPELLRDQGWVTSLFFSSSRDYTRFGDWIGHRDWDDFYDAANMPGADRHPRVAWGVPETATLEAMQARLQRHARKGERFFLTYIPAAPHQPFDTPVKEFKKFNESAGSLTGNYVGRYLNQLLYMDWVLASLLGSLEQNGQLDRTLVVITNDHGEQLGEEEGVLGHGWNLDPVLCNTPLIILDPARRGARLTPTFGSQVDVLPTVLDRLGLPLPAGELYQGLALDDPRAQRPRHLYLDSNLQRAMIVGTNYLVMDEIHGQVAPRARRFGIRNDGARTLFDPHGDIASFARQHRDFEKFQNSLVNFYGQYKDAAPAFERRGAPAASGPISSTLGIQRDKPLTPPGN